MSREDARLFFPPTDPTPIFELFRGSYATELLVAASAHLNVFGRLAKASMPEAALGQALGLERRPSVALFSVTEGRAYSAGEYRAVLGEAGLSADGAVVNTLVHCGVLTGIKPS